MSNPIIEHFEREHEYARAIGLDEEALKKSVTFLQFLHNASSLFPDIDKTGMSGLAQSYQKYLSSGVLFPLTLKEGEFSYVMPGLSMNRRNSYVKWDTKGIYYDKAYTGVVLFAYDSFTGEKQFIDNNFEHYNGDDNRIYIKTGRYITNHYFDKCYLHQSTVDSHNYTPGSPIKLNLYAYCYNKKYILFVEANDRKFTALRNLYDLKIRKDNDEYLEYFNVTKEIELCF